MAARQLYNEKELFRRIAEGDESAFRTFFDLYKNRLFRFMFSVCKSGAVAEELTHDVFLKIWLNRCSLTSVKQPAAYVFTIARNNALDHLRKAASEMKLMDQVLAGSSAGEANNITQERIDANESGQLIREAIDRLSPQKRRIFHMSRTEGMDHEKIATRLNISKNTVNNHLVQSLSAIRQYLRNKNADWR